MSKNTGISQVFYNILTALALQSNFRKLCRDFIFINSWCLNIISLTIATAPHCSIHYTALLHWCIPVLHEKALKPLALLLVFLHLAEDKD